MSSQKELLSMREDALSIFKVGLNAVDPTAAVHRVLRRTGEVMTVGSQTYNLSDFDNIFVIGAGKASAAMAKALEDILKDHLKDGLINVKVGHAVPLTSVRVVEAAHPVPDKAGLEGAREIIRLLSQTSEKDLVICLLSGGGSALLPCPVPGLTLEDKQLVTQMLLHCGANIHETNTVRKHISALKGGRLAQLAHPSNILSLILSDVIGDDLDIIASGPTVPDRSTFADCKTILIKYRLMDKVPEMVGNIVERGVIGEIADTPKTDDPIFNRSQNEIIGSNILAVEAASRKARELGYNRLILSSMIEGEAKEVAKILAAVAKEVLKTGNPIERPACIVSGGETTVTIQGSGLGGRNQELVLAAAIEIQGLRNVVMLSGGTDGTDGPTDAAGAIADGETIQRAEEINLLAEEYLENNDSYHFFEKLGDLVITGPTLTNVMDLQLILVGCP